MTRLAYSLFIISAWIIVCFIGYFRIKTMYRSIIERIDFLDEYRENFLKFANRYFQDRYIPLVDPNLYEWLTINSAKAQLALGNFGIVDIISPSNASRRDYQFIINTLPKFRKNMAYDLDSEAKDVEDILLRCHGFLLNRKENITKELKKPIKWFQSGVKFLVALPLHLLKWFGIISDTFFSSINENRIFNWISRIISFISFFGSIITVFTGWEPFKKMIQNWLY